MNVGSLWTLIRRDLVRVRGALVTSGFGIAAGTAALVFFLALGLGVRSVLLGDVFPIDQIELEPPKGEDPGLLASALGLGGDAPGIEQDAVAKIAASPDVAAVYPKLRFSFPASAQGGKEILGQDRFIGEMIADGVDPKLVSAEVIAGRVFEDPLLHPGKKCVHNEECDAPQYCEGPGDGTGVCVEPVPALVSRYLVEFFDKSIRPKYSRFPGGKTLVSVAQNFTFTMWLGQSLLGKSKQGSPRRAHIRIVGISTSAIDIGITLPLDVVRRWNAEYSGEAAARKYSSALVKLRSKDKLADVLAFGAKLGLEPTDTRARDVSVLLSGVMALLTLVAAIILIVSASNIAYTFRVLVADRRREIALYRAIGATSGDMVRWMLGLALTVGLAGGLVGVVTARLLAVVADYLAATKLPDFPFKPHTFFAFGPQLIAGALGFAALFALLGAFGPARRAGKVDPAAALAVV